MKKIGELLIAISPRGNKTLGKALSISVLNQLVTSGTTFALAIYLLRVQQPDQFGLFGIGIGICLFYSGIGNALLLTQMVVHMPSRAHDERPSYAARMLCAVVLFCLLTIGAAGLLLTLVGFSFERLSAPAKLGLAVTGASAATLLKEFFVRHAYTAQQEHLALAVNVVVAVGLLGLFWCGHQSGHLISARFAIWLYAAAHFAGAIAGLRLARLPLLVIRPNDMVKDIREAWTGGRWAVGGVSVTWVQSQAYIYVTALFFGPAGVGYANAARLLVAPVMVMIPAISQVAMPRLAELGATNLSKMHEGGKKLTLALLFVAIVYSIVILSSVDIIAPTILGAQYENMAPIVGAWCIVMLFQLARVGTSMILQVLKRFRALTLANGVSALLAIAAAVLLVHYLGVPGAVLGTAVGELVLSIHLFKLLRRHHAVR